ncbi:MAG: Hpt domain-containing protein [Planctomycetaceae bacterium]|nr:Hpt domain-containing protein [Planctomycetaceae bacterium]
MPGPTSDSVLYSEIQDDQEMLPLIEHFVCRLIDKSDRMFELLKSRRFDEIAQLAHQLKGAGGSYGYPTLSDAARAVEFSAKQEPEVENIRNLIANLADLCHQATRGLRAGACEVDYFS